MRTFQRLPVIEAETPVGRDGVGAAVVVDVPLADVGGLVAGGFERFGGARSARVERDVVHNEAVRQRRLPSEKACAGGRADRDAGDCMFELDAFVGERVQMRRFDLGVSVEAGRMGAPLVCKQDKDVRAFHRLSASSRLVEAG